MRYVLNWAAEGAPVGWERHLPVLWDDFEQTPGVYNFNRLRAWLAHDNAPVHLDLPFYFNDLVDHTPAFHKAAYVLEVGGQRAEMPKWGDATWRKALLNALAALLRFARDEPRVVALWLPLGVDQETAACKVRTGIDFPSAARVAGPVEHYLDFITTISRAVYDLAAGLPVFVQGAPVPGGVWNQSRRAVITDLLDYGLGYKMNGLTSADRPDAVGLGTRAGQMIYDSSVHAKHVAFEHAFSGTDKPNDELYLMLLRARHWGAEFVALENTWLPAWHNVVDWLPAEDVSWIAFRTPEAADMWWKPPPDGYGQGSERGCWGRGLTLATGTVQVNPYPDRRRYTLTSRGDAQLALNWPDGSTGDAVGWLAEGVSAWRFTTQNGHLTLPAGVYHRVDVRRTVADWPAKLRAVADAADVLAKTLRAAADTVAGQ